MQAAEWPRMVLKAAMCRFSPQSWRLQGREALSRLLQIGVALALWRACQDTGPDIREPSSIRKGHRYQGRAVGLEN